jgi:hypothetical protein
MQIVSTGGPLKIFKGLFLNISMGTTIEFKKMKLKEDNVTVEIIGDCFGHKINIELSILQLAKIFGADKDIGAKLQTEGFGSEELEKQCNETRELIEKFPDIKYWNNKVEFTDPSVSNWEQENNKEFIGIFAEDLCGWSNEGIGIKFPTKLYDEIFKEKSIQKLSCEPSGITIN